MHFYLKGTDLDPKLKDLLDLNLFNRLDPQLTVTSKSSDKHTDNKDKLELRYLYNKYLIFNKIISRAEDAYLIGLDHIKNNTNNEETKNKIFSLYEYYISNFVKLKGFESFDSKFSGAFFYPPENGYMGWHTNHEGFCYRLYITKSLKGDSFFRYLHKGEVITDYDPIGYSYRFFYVGDKNYPFWHCVYGGSGRYSVGVRLVKL